jgi:hypothetical protein
MHYAFFLECQLLLFSVFLCFVCCNKCLDHIMCLERDMLRFSFAKNTLVFTLIVQWVFSFSATTFSLHFLPWFLFRSCFIFSSRCIWTSGTCWYLSKECPQIGLNGVGKEKKLYAKKWYKKEIV